MDTREWQERFDRLKPDEKLDVLMALLAASDNSFKRAETPVQMRERQMLAAVGVDADEALDCQTIKPDAFKTLHFKKPKFEWPHITLALPIDPKSWYPLEYTRPRQRDELRDAILAFKELNANKEDI